jgi:hypothetical protein
MYNQASIISLCSAHYNVNLTRWTGDGLPKQADLEIILHTPKGKRKLKADNIMGKGVAVSKRISKFLQRHRPTTAADLMETIYHFIHREMTAEG